MRLILFATFFILLLMEVPIAFCLFIAATVALLFGGSVPITVVIQRAVTSADTFILLSIPFFMLAGNLMSTGGISKKIMNVATSMVGFIRGGLAHVNIVTSMLFAGITGAAVADTSAIGSMIIPAMKEEGYGKAFTVAVTASSSVIGVIIPPSIPFVIYGVVAEVSIGKLFLGGLIPGILIGLSQMVISYVISKNRNYGRKRSFNLSRLVVDFRDGIWALFMPIIILGGIVLGIVTPTEASVLATLYALFVGFFIHRDLKMKDLPKIFLESAQTTAVVMFMIVGASLYGLIITQEQIPLKLVKIITSISSDPKTVLFMFALVYFGAGLFLDLGAAIILIVPILYPTAKLIGIDPLLLGIITVVCLAAGLVTPPVGPCLFIACEIGGCSIIEATKEAIPFIIAIFVLAGLIILIPDIAIAIPNAIIK